MALRKYWGKEPSRINKCWTLQSIPPTSTVKLSRVKVNLFTHILMQYYLNSSNLCFRACDNEYFPLTVKLDCWARFWMGICPLQVGGLFFCMCSWRGGEAGFQASWTSDLIRSGTWHWLELLRGGWPGSPAGNQGWAPRALPGAGPAGIAACQTLGLQNAGSAWQRWARRVQTAFEASPKSPALPWKTPPVLNSP